MAKASDLVGLLGVTRGNKRLYYIVFSVQGSGFRVQGLGLLGNNGVLSSY